MKLSDRAEEILEALWIAVEEKGHGYAEREKIRVAADDPAYEELTALAFIEVKEGRVYLRQEGKEEGRRTIRRHRLGGTADDGCPQYPGGDRRGQGLPVRAPPERRGGCQGLRHAEPSATCPHGKPIPPGECATRPGKRGTWEWFPSPS